MIEVLEKTELIIEDRKPVKVCAMSDLHGNFPTVEECDLVLICGDLVSLECQSSNNATKRWYLQVFKPWAEALPCDKVLFIAGNHELHFRKDKLWVREQFSTESKVTYLEHELYEYKGLRIFGTPYCKKFGNWEFMYSSDILEHLFDLIPYELDILMTHDSPYGYCDVLLDTSVSWAKGDHIGNKPLVNAIEKKQPEWVFCGHLHSGNHSCEYLNNSFIRNVSLLDEHYQMVYEPYYQYI